MVKHLKVKTGDQFKSVVFEKYDDLLNLDAIKKQFLSAQIHSILIDCWGKFHEDFIEKHVLAGNRLIMAKADDRCIGFCVLSFKNICGVDVRYIEFLAVKKAFQRSSVGPRLFYLSILEDIKKSFFRLLHKPLDIMFITPSMRALAQMARFASFIYPNPRFAEPDGSVPQADELTWNMAQELIRISDKPNRKICREGLVVEGSYADAPWLVYGPEEAPSTNDSQMKRFAKRYLGYHNKEDKELVVRAHITMASIIKYEIMHSR
ncbi:MAG: GNAT family N-acetyltransferase [Candidatus Omnitrophota bacterium]